VGYRNRSGLYVAKEKPVPSIAGCPYKIGDKVTLPPLYVSGFKAEENRVGRVVEIYKNYVVLQCENYRETVGW